MWDADGNKYIDYHGAFAPYLLGHHAPSVDDAVVRAVQEGWALMGSGTTPWEGRAAELLCACVPTVDKVQLATTGSEATYHALRLSRAYTGRDHIVVMQGGYNGWHDEVACNVMTPLARLGPRTRGGEYPFVPLSAGMPSDIESARPRHRVQRPGSGRVGVPYLPGRLPDHRANPPEHRDRQAAAGYLQGLRSLCDEYGVVLVFDEVKTGFRHALGGYQSIAGVKPDLTTFGKAIANGYPLGAIGGNAAIMDLFADPDPNRRVLIAGTYNGHPIPLAASIATMETLLKERDTLYPRLEALGLRLEQGLEALFERHAIEATIARQGSAFCVYFMDHAPATGTTWRSIMTWTWTFAIARP